MFPPVSQSFPRRLQSQGASRTPPVLVPPYVSVPDQQQGLRQPFASMQKVYPAIPSPGVPHYASVYTPMVRPGFVPCPPDASIIPPVQGQQLVLTQPFTPVLPYPAIPAPGVPRYASAYVRPEFVPHPPDVLDSVPEVLSPQIRKIIDFVPSVTPIEKLRNMVYVGRIASTVENNFILDILRFCGPVKSWKRPKGFGFCEFESAEGVLRALRLLNGFNIDGKELVVTVNQTTREYLENYVQRKGKCLKKNKKESFKKFKEAETADSEEGGEVPSPEKSEPPKPSDHVIKKDVKDAKTEEKIESANYGIVSDADKEIDRETLTKLTDMIKLRLKNHHFLPPQVRASDGSNTLILEQIAESENGEFSVDDKRNGKTKRDEKMAREAKPYSNQDRLERSSPERARKKERTRRDGKRDKQDEDKELERYEREHKYKELVKNWEYRERKKEYEQKEEKEKENRRGYYRKQKILDEERESKDGHSKNRKHEVSRSERNRRRWEKENDLVERLKEEEEVNGRDEAILAHQIEAEIEDGEITCNGNLGNENHTGNDIKENGDGHESVAESTSALESISNLDTTAESAKQISLTTFKEEELKVEREQGLDKKKTLHVQEPLDGKQLMDMIPKTKEELFSYEINWDVFDKNKLHDRMRPWIAKKIVEFLGVEEPSLVSSIVSSTQEHIQPVEMMKRLVWILDVETERFVVKMWKILIFEIKKIETGLSNEANLCIM